MPLHTVNFPSLRWMEEDHMSMCSFIISWWMINFHLHLWDSISCFLEGQCMNSLFISYVVFLWLGPFLRRLVLGFLSPFPLWPAFLYRYFIFRSFRSTKTFMGLLLCTLEPHVSSRLKYLWRSIPSLKLHSWPGERNFYHLKFRFHLYLRFFSAVWPSYLLCFSAWHLFMPYFPVKCW